MIDQRVAEIGHAESLGDHSAGRVERMGAEDEPGLAVLLEGNPVVHTARRAGASITDCGNQEVDVVGDSLEDLRLCDSAGVELAGVDNDAAT